ncbi:MAG: stage V sporulation protein B [Oscillospiraceae bacterium]|nr:stage V sporulation protein B [Oscillospiraceae bacterium]
MKEQKSMISSTLLLTAVNLLSQLMGFGCRIGISRLAGAEVMGVYMLILPAYGVLRAAAISGPAVAVASAAGQLSGGHGPGKPEAVLYAALKLFAGGWLLLSVPIVLLGDAISVRLLGDARTMLGLTATLPCLLLSGVEALHKQYFYAMGEIRTPAVIELGEQLIQALGALALLALFPQAVEEEQAALIILGSLGGELYSAVALHRAQRRLTGRQLPLNAGRLPGLNRRLLTIAVPISLASVLGSVLSAANAVVIPNRLVHAGLSVEGATEEYGVLFGMTMPLLMMPTCFVGALCTLLLPNLSRRSVQEGAADCRRQILHILKLVSAILLPILLCLNLWGGPLCAVLFQDQRAGDGIGLLSLVVLLNCWDAILGTSLNGLGGQRESSAVGILCGAVQLFLTILLTGRWGIQGCINSLLIAAGLETLLRWQLMHRLCSKACEKTAKRGLKPFPW